MFTIKIYSVDNVLKKNSLIGETDGIFFEELIVQSTNEEVEDHKYTIYSQGKKIGTIMFSTIIFQIGKVPKDIQNKMDKHKRLKSELFNKKISNDQNKNLEIVDKVAEKLLKLEFLKVIMDDK